MEMYPREASEKQILDLGRFYKIEQNLKELNKLFLKLNVPLSEMGPLRDSFMEGWRRLEQTTELLKTIKPHEELFNK